MRVAGTWAALLCVVPAGAAAHATGLSYGDFIVRGDRVDVSLLLSRSEIEAMGLAPDVLTATAGALEVSRGGHRCAFVPGGATPEAPDGVRVAGAFACPRAGEPIVIAAGRMLANLSPGHTHLAKVTAGTRVEEHAARPGHESFVVAAPPSWTSQAVRFLSLGVEHIFTGYDHIAFVLGLLLLGSKLRDVIGTVTSFTVAHSVTLAVAALDLVRPPPTVVEPLIAASIVCVAIENLAELRRPTERGRGRRWRLGFAFGLVHGFGFAAALSQLHLSSAGLATALVSFNAGVELGQAAIVAIVFPMLAALGRWPAVAPVLLRTGSIAIGAAGAFWLVQRMAAPRLG